MTQGTPAARATKAATGTIPIVMTSVSDPVRIGLVASLSRPGGNVTGLTIVAIELAAKRLELLKDAVPKVARVGVVWDASGSAWLAEARKQRVDALLVMPSPVLNYQRRHLVELAAKERLPASYQAREFVEADGLMSYGPDLRDRFRRAATYVDKILKGSAPADLPVEQPTKFQLVVNLKTAKALGLTIPPALLTRADELIR